MRRFLFSVFLLLTACSTPVTPVAPGTGGVLQEVMVGDPTTFNPVTARRGSALTLVRLLFVGLVTPPDAQGKVLPELAEQWQASEGGRRWRLTLHPGLRWSDEKPLDTRDIIFSYGSIYLNPQSASGIDTRVQVRAIDDSTIEFELPLPDAHFLERLHLPILPEHAFVAGSSVFDAWGLSTDPTTLPTNGPFLCTDYRRGEHLDLVANRNYWRSNAQQPYLAGIRYGIVADRAEGIRRLRAGVADSWQVDPDEYAALTDGQATEGYRLHNGGPTPTAPLLAFNLNRGRDGEAALVEPTHSNWFNDLRFRQAIAFALDRKAMVESAYLNTAEVAPWPYDPQRARQLLSAAGLRPSSDGKLADARGNPVGFSLLVNSENRPAVALASRIATDLEVLGIEVTVEPLASTQIRNRLRSTLRWQAVLVDPTDLGAFPLDRESILRSTGPWHFFNLQQPGRPGTQVNPWEKNADELLNALHSSAAGQSTQAAESRLNKLLDEQLPMIETVRPLGIAAVATTVRSGEFDTRASTYYGRVLWNIWAVQKPVDTTSTQLAP